MRYLPGYLRNVGPHVDGIIALDDGSRDSSGDFLESSQEVLEVIRVPADRREWDELGNHRALVAAALRHGADWILSLDADERVERDFRARAERVIARGRLLGMTAFRLRYRELWDAPDQYRVDGIWDEKTRGSLFRAASDHIFDPRPLHGRKAPMQARWRGRYPLADLTIYHLGMLRAEDRAARRERYERLDPDARWQPELGYAYLTDERGLRLRKIPGNRGYLA